MNHVIFNKCLVSYRCFIAGISIIEDGSEGITMELEMQWDGNPSIILDIKTYVGVALPVQVTICTSELCRIL